MGNQGSNPRGRALYSHAQGAWWQVLFSPRSQGKRRVPPLRHYRAWEAFHGREHADAEATIKVGGESLKEKMDKCCS